MRKALIFNKECYLLAIINYKVPYQGTSIDINFLTQGLESKLQVGHAYVYKEVIMVEVDPLPGYYRQLCLGEQYPFTFVFKPIRILK